MEIDNSPLIVTLNDPEEYKCPKLNHIGEKYGLIHDKLICYREDGATIIYGEYSGPNIVPEKYGPIYSFMGRFVCLCDKNVWIGRNESGGLFYYLVPENKTTKIEGNKLSKCVGGQYIFTYDISEDGPAKIIVNKVKGPEIRSGPRAFDLLGEIKWFEAQINKTIRKYEEKITKISGLIQRIYIEATEP